MLGWLLVLIGHVGPSARVQTGATCETGSGRLVTSKTATGPMAFARAITVPNERANTGLYVGRFHLFWINSERPVSLWFIRGVRQEMSWIERGNQGMGWFWLQDMHGDE